mmetsp:Transcript_60883/g.125440  ORF Transcript_60883/g.125440 Transcript_60883/m.125440 type:complete len:105 (+) Transcript_60883:527-841(+)
MTPGHTHVFDPAVRTYDIVWIRYGTSGRHVPALLGFFQGPCAVEFAPLYTALHPSVPTPHFYTVCRSQIDRVLTPAELEYLVANPLCCELTREALLAAHLHLAA